MDWQAIINMDNFSKSLATGIVIAVVMLLNHFITREITRWDHRTDLFRRRWLVAMRNLTSIMLIVAIIFIWQEPLKEFATTILVVAVAIAISIREVFHNFAGFIWSSGNRYFAIGDRIEIDAHIGDVVDHSFMGTTILEVDPKTKSRQYTGRSIFIPNGMFLSRPLTNESYLREYKFHIIVVPQNMDKDWQSAEIKLLEAANEICAPYKDKVQQHTEKMESRHSLSIPTAEPRIYIELPDPGRINLILRVPVPSRQRGRTEQAILRLFLEKMKED